MRTSGGIGFILFAAGATIGSYVSYDPVLSWPMLLTVLGSIGLFLMIATLPPQWSARGLIVAAALVALYFVSQYAHFDYPLENGIFAQLGRLTSGLMPNLVFYTPHPNAIAGFLEGVFLLSLALIWQARGPNRWLWYLFAVLIAYGLIISDSRGAWIALVVASGIWILLQFSRRISQFIGVGGGIATSLFLGGIATFWLLLSGRNFPFIESLLRTAATRLSLYRNSLYLFGDYPFTGIGPGDTFALVYSRYQLLINVPYYYYAHNLYLSIALAQGIVGIIGLGLLLFVLYRFVFRVERTKQNTIPTSQNKLIFRAAWLGITTSLIHGLTDAVQYSVDYWTMPMIFVLAGLTAAAGRPLLAKTEQPKTQRSERVVRWGRGVAIGALILVGLFLWRPLTSAWYANLGAIQQTRADLSPYINEATRQQLLSEAGTYFERALALDPNRTSATRRLGLIALDRGEYDRAVIYLERAYIQEPNNQLTLKALGYAYLWSGQLEQAQPLFQRVRFRSRLLQELEYSHRQLAAQGRQDLSHYAGEMAHRLARR